MSVSSCLSCEEVYAVERTHVVWTLPPEATLQIVVAEHHIHQPLQYQLALCRIEANDRAGLCKGISLVNACLLDLGNTYVCAEGEHTLPSGYGIRADDRVHSFHRSARIVRMTTRV
jgi:hypothetical protein